jgi:hypothetical protein
MIHWLLTICLCFYVDSSPSPANAPSPPPLPVLPLSSCVRKRRLFTSHPFVPLATWLRLPLQSVRIQRTDGQASVSLVSISESLGKLDWKSTYGGLLLRSVLRITGTLVISVTSWIYSPPSSRSLNRLRYFSLLLK